jgi:hypothetical protein
VFSGCSSNPAVNSTTSNVAADPAVNSNQSNTNTVAATNSNPNGGMVPYGGVQNINSNVFNATNDNLKVIPYQPKKDELPSGSRNAPDDSIISSGSRGKEFLETRTFKNHPVLAKVEKSMDGKITKYKVFLKNGKVFDAPADKMGNFTVTSPDTILAEIGILPKPQTNPPTKTEGKEAQKQ